MTNQATDFLGRLEEYEKMAVSLLTRSGQMKSVSTKFSTVYAYFLTRRQLTQSQLQKLTGFSSGSISQIVNQLLSLDVLIRKNIPGSHEKTYELAGMGSVAFGSVLRKLRVVVHEYDSLISTAKNDLEVIKGNVAALSKRGPPDLIRLLTASAIPERIHRLESFLSGLSTIVPILRRINEIIKDGLGSDAF